MGRLLLVWEAFGKLLQQSTDRHATAPCTYVTTRAAVPTNHIMGSSEQGKGMHQRCRCSRHSLLLCRSA